MPSRDDCAEDNAASDRYDAAIRGHPEPRYSAERLFFDFALGAAAAAGLFRPIYDATGAGTGSRRSSSHIAGRSGAGRSGNGGSHVSV